MVAIGGAFSRQARGGSTQRTTAAAGPALLQWRRL
jgi:hypothetical protein